MITAGEVWTAKWTVEYSSHDRDRDVVTTLWQHPTLPVQKETVRNQDGVINLKYISGPFFTDSAKEMADHLNKESPATF